MGFTQFGMFVEQVASTATSGGTTTLVNNSKQMQVFTGSSPQTLVLPDATTMVAGQWFEIYNESTGLISLQNNDASTFSANPTLSPGNSLVLKLSSNGTANGTWALQTGGGGSGSGTGKNYLSTYQASTGSGPNPGNGSFQNGSTLGWSLAHSSLSSLFPSSVATAGSAFSATSGGSAASGNLSINVGTGANALVGSYGGILASSATSVAGDMLISNAFNIDQEDQAKVMTVQFSFKNGGGAFDFSGTSTNSFAIYIYDVTNAVWIQPSNVYGIAQSSGVGKTFAQFQSSSNGTQYQLAIVNINSVTGAYTLVIDDFSVGPQANAGYGVYETDPVNYTPTIGGTTVSSSQLFYERKGKNLRVFGTYATSAASASTFFISLPNGLQIDSSVSGTNNAWQVGWLTAQTGSGNLIPSGQYGPWPLFVDLSTSTSQIFGSYLVAFTKSNANDFVGSPISVDFTVPILGWSSQQQIVSQYDGRVVGLNANATSPGTFTSGATITGWGGPTQDTHGEFNATTGVYTIPVSGWYDVAAQLSANAGGGTTYGAIQLILAGSQAGTYTGPYANANTAVGVQSNISKTILLVAGDTIAIAGTWNGSSTQAVYLVNLSVNLISGAQQILAGQRIVAEYYLSATTGALSDVPVNFDTKITDTMGAVTTGSGWKFTAPCSGEYLVTYGIVNDSGLNYMHTLVNGTMDTRSRYIGGASTSVPFVSGSTMIYLNAGDYVQLICHGGGTITGGADSYAYFSTISIKQI